MQAQSYLDQARLQKTVQHLEMALALYDQSKVTFKHAADARQLVPPLAEVKDALNQARIPQTPEEETLRQRIAEVYFERAELLKELGKPDKAQASYKKAQAWGYEGIMLAPIAPAVSMPTRGARALTRTATSTAMPIQRLRVASSTQEKSVLVDYLFEKALSTLSSLEISNKPSLFLVYAHDNPTHGKAEADTSKYLIDKLSKIRVNLYSDQTPMGQTYSSPPEGLKEDSKLEDILTNQLCLLPTQLRKDVKPANKVVVCCSEVLGSYLEWSHYKNFYHALREAYLKDREQSCNVEVPKIRAVVRKFSQESEYKVGFHHVLTEMAFLQIRVEHLKDQHGIIPVSLTPDSYKHCLEDFISATTVRMEDIPRFEEQTNAGREVYPNQSRHWVLFKLIQRLLVGSDEAKTFLDKFWEGYSDFIFRLKSDSTLGELEFAKLLDGIFDGIRTALHSQLAFTVQQQHRMLNADPRAILKAQYFTALKQDQAFLETLQLYFEPRGKASLHGNETFNLLPELQEFLKDKKRFLDNKDKKEFLDDKDEKEPLDNKKVILLTGDSGAGKTTFNRVLEKQLWETKKEEDAIPLLISLASIDKPEGDLIAKALKKRGLSEFQIQMLKKEKQKFVFILDGYDEIRHMQNLYLSNRINQPDGWQGHIVISCRTEYLGHDYRSRFQPNQDQQGKAPSFEEVVLEPFSEKECIQYLEKYVEHNLTGWTVQQYREVLEQPPLKDLASNPFLLQVILKALPHLENKWKKERSPVQLRLDLYDWFVRQWFDRNQHRLSTQNLTGTKKEIFRELSDDGFAQHGIAFVQELAVHLYTENAGHPVVEYSLFKDEGNWKYAFFGREDKKQLLREAGPLSRSGNQYRFIHKSLLEYCVVRVLFDSFDACMVPDTHPRRGSTTSVYSFENQPVLPPRTLRDVSLSPKHWVGDLGVVRWLIERVWQETTFKQQLLSIIERSKTDTRLRRVAANAITILVRAGVQFNEADLKGIHIPGADLSDGVFDSAQLQGADLRKVTLRKTWLRQANLSGTQMTGVQFGELPFLKENRKVSAREYSPAEKTYIMGLENGTISVYGSEARAEIYNLSGHTSYVSSVAYSPNGQRIASGSADDTVRLWDARTGQHCRTLSGHTDKVNSVAYSPNGQQIASGGDNTVRLWDAHTGQHRHTLSKHNSCVWSIAYSPDGQQIASSSFDNTVQVWDTHSGQHRHTLSGHTSWVISVVYSPNGQQIASGSYDNTVRLWDAHTGQHSHTLSGHIDYVSSVTYSPNGQQIASGSLDYTVRLWDAHTGQHSHILSGHTEDVNSVAYSPTGQQIASGSNDNTVRLWDARTGQHRHTLSGHSGSVLSVEYSPNRQQIASGSSDHTVRLWGAHSGQCQVVIQDFSGSVYSVVWKVKPDGNYLVTGSADKSVRRWEVKKEGEKYKAVLSWSSGHELLTVTDTLLEGVRGLSGMNEQLLKQRGAVFERSSPLNSQRGAQGEAAGVMRAQANSNG